jgi:uncharacterized protein (TIRG00374 family)
MKLRHAIFFFGVTALIILLIFQFGQIQNFINLLKHAHWWVLLLIIPLRYLYYRFNAVFFRQFFGIFHQKAPFKKLFSATVTMNFVNIVFPSAGISGLSYIRSAMSDEVDSSTTTLAQLVWYVLCFITYIFLLGIGFCMLLLSNQVLKVSSRLILLILAIILIIGVTVIVLVLNRGLTENLAFTIARPINWIMRKARRRPFGKARIRQFLTQMHDSLEFLRSHRSRLYKPLLSVLIMTILDMAGLYIVFIAFGKFVNPGVVITGYVIALLASLASVLTSGIGAYEAAMITTFVGLGLSFDVAFSVTLTYRVVTLWMFLPVGLLFYKRALIDEADQKEMAAHND